MWSEVIEKILFQKIYTSWKASTKKASSPLKNVYLYKLWYLAILKTLDTHVGNILTLKHWVFLIVYIYIYIYIYMYVLFIYIYIYMFLKQCFLIVFHFSTHNQLSAFFRENNAIQNRWMSVHVTSDPRGRGELFQAPSSPFYLVRACSSSSYFFHATALQIVFTCKFTIS